MSDNLSFALFLNHGTGGLWEVEGSLGGGMYWLSKTKEEENKHSFELLSAWKGKSFEWQAENEVSCYKLFGNFNHLKFESSRTEKVRVQVRVSLLLYRLINNVLLLRI